MKITNFKKYLLHAFLIGIFFFVSGFDNSVKTDSNHEGILSCSQSTNFSVSLQTTSGATVTQVQANTSYDLVVSGVTTPGVNVAYCTIFGIGFTPVPQCKDRPASGVVKFRITTSSSITDQGIFGAIGPTDCSGSSASAQAFSKPFQYLRL